MPKEYGKKKEIEKKIKEVYYLFAALKKFWDSCKQPKRNSHKRLKQNFHKVWVNFSESGYGKVSVLSEGADLRKTFFRVTSQNIQNCKAIL